MQTLMNHFPNLQVGYSDHTLSPIASLCAVAMGARVIERHFTLDKTNDGPDHMLSSDPAEMKWLVESIRSFELMRGDGIKRPADSEQTNRRNNRKSLVLNSAVSSGERITKEVLSVKRPGTGIQPRFYDEVIGRTVARHLDPDTVLQWEHLT